LAIRTLKRYAIDHATDIDRPLKPPVKGKKEVAIIGSGPAGLSCAYFLALLGRPSIIFESLPIPGGMLSVGIPEYRLPKGSLQVDIDFILSHGVELRTNSAVENLSSLMTEGYKAIFVATGAHVGQALRIPGEDLEGVEDALQFLRGRALGHPVPCGRKVAIIGGGNAAIDTARSALRLGVDKVSILYRRTREEMPAYAEEIEAALEEGVELFELAAPRRIIGEDGKVVGIEMMRMRLGDVDEQGRRRPVSIEGSEFTIECDMVLPAIGQKPSTAIADGVIKLHSWGGIQVDALTGASSESRVFAGGDCVSGGTTVIEAIGMGQRAAVTIDRMLGGSGLLLANVGMSMWRPSEEDLEKTVPRVKEPMLDVQRRRVGFDEVLDGLTPGDACRESGRCLRCDLERAESLTAGRGR